MSNFNNSLPQPPRNWYRIQTPCIELSLSEVNKIAMLNKGNVLQFKANSSNLTKAQKYSNIAKGFNNNTTWQLNQRVDILILIQKILNVLEIL